MYDYVDGKVDWMADGLPVEGDDGPFLGSQVSATPTCDVRLTVADARRVHDESGADVVVLVSADGLAVGDLDGEVLEATAGDVRLLDVLRPVPSTVRPSVTVASVAGSGGGRPLVTNADGRLLGRADVEAADDHDHDHDHDGHAHGDPPVDGERYESELAAVMKSVEDHFGDGEPPAEELRVFLRDRLVAEGRTVEEADRVVDQLEAGGDD